MSYTALGPGTQGMTGWWILRCAVSCMFCTFSWTFQKFPPRASEWRGRKGAVQWYRKLPSLTQLMPQKNLCFYLHTHGRLHREPQFLCSGAHQWATTGIVEWRGRQRGRTGANEQMPTWRIQWNTLKDPVESKLKTQKDKVLEKWRIPPWDIWMTSFLFRIRETHSKSHNIFHWAKTKIFAVHNSKCSKNIFFRK